MDEPHHGAGGGRPGVKSAARTHAAAARPAQAARRRQHRPRGAGGLGRPSRTEGLAAPARLQHADRDRDPQAPAQPLRHDAAALRLSCPALPPPRRPADERAVALPDGDRRQRDRPDRRTGEGRPRRARGRPERPPLVSRQPHRARPARIRAHRGRARELAGRALLWRRRCRPGGAVRTARPLAGAARRDDRASVAPPRAGQCGATDTRRKHA